MERKKIICGPGIGNCKHIENIEYSCLTTFHLDNGGEDSDFSIWKVEGEEASSFGIAIYPIRVDKNVNSGKPYVEYCGTDTSLYTLYELLSLLNGEKLDTCEEAFSLLRKIYPGRKIEKSIYDDMFMGEESIVFDYTRDLSSWGIGKTKR